MMFPDVPARMAYGAMHYCDFRDAVAAEFAVLGRRGVCGIEKFPKTLCPNFHSCDGSKMPETHRGEVLFTSHAMARRLQPDLTIIDEDCGIIQTHSVSQAEVISIFGNNSMQQSVKSWLNHINADAPAGAFYFNKMASDALSKNFSWTKTSAYDIRLSGMELFNLLSTNPLDLGSLLQGYDESATPPPKPLPNQVRSGWNLSKHLPSQRAYRALVELASAMRECMKPEDERNMFLANRVSLLLHTDSPLGASRSRVQWTSQRAQCWSSMRQGLTSLSSGRAPSRIDQSSLRRLWCKALHLPAPSTSTASASLAASVSTVAKSTDTHLLASIAFWLDLSAKSEPEAARLKASTAPLPC